jgi:hypothetical protein
MEAHPTDVSATTIVITAITARQFMVSSLLSGSRLEQEVTKKCDGAAMGPRSDRDPPGGPTSDVESRAGDTRKEAP